MTLVICNFFRHYYNCWFILALLQLTTYACTLAVVNFCIHYCHFCIHSCDWPLLYTIAIDRVYMLYLNWLLLSAILQLKNCITKSCENIYVVAWYHKRCVHILFSERRNCFQYQNLHLLWISHASWWKNNVTWVKLGGGKW